MYRPRILIVHRSKTIHSIFEQLLSNLGVEGDTVSSEDEIWPLMKQQQDPYFMVLVSRQSVGKDIDVFVRRFRSIMGYEATPLILLVNNKSTHQDAEFYHSGFTRVFSVEDFVSLETYVEQSLKRHQAEYIHQKQVLVIEDDLSQQVLLQAVLEQASCQVICFKSAEEALEASDEVSPQVIICDFFLQGNMTALDFIPKIKQADHPWFMVPILVMSGLDDTSRRHELIRSGANDFLVKPLDMMDLMVKVENLLRYKLLLDKVEEQSQKMQYLAMHDALTGLYNRHFISERVHHAIAEAHRHKVDYCIVEVDVDHFKKVNDQYGHDMGDKVLIAVSQVLQNQLRDEDIAARLGGEEFILLLNRCSLKDACAKSEELRLEIENLEPEGIKVTASFGVAQLTDEVKDFDGLFKLADKAVYQAKELGRNRVEYAAISSLVESKKFTGYS